MLKNVYEVKKGFKSHYVIVVDSDLAYGRLQLVSLGLNRCHSNIYETIEEVEETLNRMRLAGAFDSVRKVDAKIKVIE